MPRIAFRQGFAEKWRKRSKDSFSDCKVLLGPSMAPGGLLSPKSYALWASPKQAPSRGLRPTEGAECHAMWHSVTLS